MIDRRSKATGIGAAVAAALLLWTLLWRDAPLRPVEAAAGWLMLAGIAAWAVHAWRRRG
ncbi:MAG: hypothetical protein IT542_06440 [Rubellimicrobium sp.]|nr:hypothetical protein [Rubellimicrobium sp.]